MGKIKQKMLRDIEVYGYAYDLDGYPILSPAEQDELDAFEWEMAEASRWTDEQLDAIERADHYTGGDCDD